MKDWRIERFKQKNLKYAIFYDFNLDNAVGRFNREIKQYLNNQFFYFWKKDLTLFDIVDKIKNWNLDTKAEINLAKMITSTFWNRTFIDQIYKWYDKSAKGCIKYITFIYDDSTSLPHKPIYKKA